MIKFQHTSRLLDAWAKRRRPTRLGLSCLVWAVGRVVCWIHALRFVGFSIVIYLWALAQLLLGSVSFPFNNEKKKKTLAEKKKSMRPFSHHS